MQCGHLHQVPHNLKIVEIKFYYVQMMEYYRVSTPSNILDFMFSESVPCM
jgi:hypothetical protein